MKDYRIGTMADDIEAAGTMLKIKKGARVKVYEATNLPDDSEFKYFVAPINCPSIWQGFTIAARQDDVIV